MAKRTEAKSNERTVSAVDIAIPLAQPDDSSYQAKLQFDQLHISRLSRPQREALRHVYGGLRQTNATIEGKPVVYQADAVRWILEQIANNNTTSQNKAIPQNKAILSNNQ